MVYSAINCFFLYICMNIEIFIQKIYICGYDQMILKRPATITFFEIFYFLFKSFVKVELSYVFTINLFTIAENCTEK